MPDYICPYLEPYNHKTIQLVSHSQTLSLSLYTRKNGGGGGGGGKVVWLRETTIQYDIDMAVSVATYRTDHTYHTVHAC